MTAPRARRSPMSFVVLALLREEPMHSYRLHKLITRRGKDRVVNVAQRNSVQQAITRLLRDELIEVQERQRDANYPERVLYRITRAGEAAMRDWLAHMLTTPAAEFPQFPAALAFLALSSPGEAVDLLATRREALAVREAAIGEALVTRPDGASRIFAVEQEYALAMVRAERGWLDSIIGEIRAGTLIWDAEHHLGGEEPVPSAVPGAAPRG